MNKNLAIIIVTISLLLSPFCHAQATPESASDKGSTEKIVDALKEANIGSTENSGLNSLNIPVDGLNGPGADDLGWSMLQYMMGDVSVQVYNKMFNNTSSSSPAGGVVTGTTLLLAIMSGIGLLMLYTVLFYVVVFGLLFSNVSGKPFGERWSTPHLAIRSLLSLSLLQPMARFSGLNGGQVLIFGLALLSMGFAGAIFRQINSTMLTTPIVSYNMKDLDTVFMQLANAHMCQATLKEVGIVKSDWYSQEVSTHYTAGLWKSVQNALWSEQANDIDMNERNTVSYCIGPECVCGKFSIEIPKVEPVTPDTWDAMQLEDLYGDWITQYMFAEGAKQINDLFVNYLDPDGSPLNPSANIILNFAKDTSKSKNTADIGKAADELEAAYNEAYTKAWLSFKSSGYNFLNDKISVDQINIINQKMAETLSKSGFVTAGFAHYIWMQRQEKINSVFNSVVLSSIDTNQGPQYEDNDYLDIIDVDDSIVELVKYPIDLQQKLVSNLALKSKLPSDFNSLLLTAAKGETEDSYVGSFLNTLSTYTQIGLLSTPRIGTGSTWDTPDPVMEMKMMGDTIFSVLIYGGAALYLLEKTPAGGMSKKGKDALSKLNDKSDGFASILGASLFAAFLGIAFAYSFVIPSIPFVMFTLGVAAYFAYLFAVLGGSTTWIATWALPDGHDVFGHGGSGWSMVATLALKPTFMLVGLVLGSTIIKTMGFYVNSTYLPSMLAMNSGVNPAHLVGNMTIYATLMSVLVYKSYGLIFEFGELVFAMIGVNGQHASFFKAGEASNALTGLNTVASSKVASTTKDSVGAMLRLKTKSAQP